MLTQQDMQYLKLMKEKFGDQLLSAEEESDLIAQFAQGPSDDAAAALDTLVSANWRLVAKCAGKYCGKGVSLEDLFQAGVVGFIEAVRDFNPQMEGRLSTYAFHCIRAQLQKTFAGLFRPVRLQPRHCLMTAQFRAAEQKLRQSQNGGCVPAEEVFDHMNIPPQNRETYRLAISACTPAAYAPNNEDTGNWLLESLPDLGSAGNLSRLHLAKNAVERLLNEAKLQPEELLILQKRFGLGEDESLAPKAIAQELGMGITEVQQTMRRAIRKLKLVVSSVAD